MPDVCVNPRNSFSGASHAPTHDPGQISLVRVLVVGANQRPAGIPLTGVLIFASGANHRVGEPVPRVVGAQHFPASVGADDLHADLLQVLGGAAAVTLLVAPTGHDAVKAGGVEVQGRQFHGFHRVTFQSGVYVRWGRFEVQLKQGNVAYFGVTKQDIISVKVAVSKLASRTIATLLTRQDKERIKFLLNYLRLMLRNLC